MKDNNPQPVPQSISSFVNYKGTEQLAQISWLNMQAVTPIIKQGKKSWIWRSPAA